MDSSECEKVRAGDDGNCNRLIGNLRQLLGKYILTLKNDDTKGILSFPPSLNEDVSHSLLANVRRSGLVTFVVSAKMQWNPRDRYHERIRELARKGVKIQRVFLLPQRILLRDEQLLAHWALDKEAGIETTFVLVGGALGAPSLEAVETLDYGIWDDGLVCFVTRPTQMRTSGGPEWRISTRPEDIEFARSTTAMLLEHGEVLPQPDEATCLLDLEEPMVRTAPFARMLSEVVCRGSYLAGDSCAWYHGIWQYLRIFDMVSTPTWHKQFYSDSLAHMTKCPNARVLVSGTADYSTMAHVLWYGWDQHSDIDVTVLDLCETPLLLCKWYAQKQGLTITTEATSILTYESDSFDLIITDAFLTRFDADSRRKVVAKWHNLLKPKGRIVTTVRIREDAPVPSMSQISDFRSRAFDTAMKWRDFIDISPGDLAEMASEYAAKMESCPVNSINSIRSLFTDAGFSLDYCEEAVVRGELEETTYCEIVARR